MCFQYEQDCCICAQHYYLALSMDCSVIKAMTALMLMVLYVINVSVLTKNIKQMWILPGNYGHFVANKIKKTLMKKSCT